jgi:hypothetical protein
LRIQGGNLLISYCGAGYGGLNNLPGALVDMAADCSITTSCGGPGFINGGTLRKSVGTGTNAIAAAPFISSGTVDAQSGTISLNGGSGSGLFSAEAGATLAFSSGTFTLTGNMISSNAVLAGATLSGNGAISGVLNWNSGVFGSGNNAFTLATNAMLILAGTNGGTYLIGQAVTNAGILRIQSGNLQIAYCGGGQYGVFVNLPGALVDLTADVSIGDDSCGPGIVNEGTVRKSGGTGTSDIYGVFMSTSTVDAQTGTISFNGTDSGSGLFSAEPGATLAFTSGTFAFTGNLISSNAVLAGATLSGNGTISGVLTWTSGVFGSGNNAFTLATNAMLILAGTNGGTYLIEQTVTNAGIVRIQSGNLQMDYCGGGQYGAFVNLPGALVDMTADVSIGDDGCGSGIVNQGLVRKSGGTGISGINGLFVNAGTVDAQTGAISFNGTASGGGVFAAAPGATLALSGGTFTLTGNLTSSNVVLAGATLSGNGTITGAMTWTSGTFGAGDNALTLATNATLILAGTNGGTYLIEQAVTNAGIVRVQSGNLQINYCGGGQFGTFVNLPGALVDLTADVSMGDDGCAPGIVNEGTVRKSGGTGSSDIHGVFLNAGTVDAQIGTISFNGSATGGGVFAAENGATLAFSSGTVTLNGTLTSSNAVLAGATLSGNGAISGVLNWTSGMFGAGDNALTVATNGTLVLAGTNGDAYLIEQAVTNAGIVRIQSGNLQINYCGGSQFGIFVNLPGALVDLAADVSIGDDGCGPGIVNEGTVRKSGGTGASDISGVFLNAGTVDAQTGVIDLNGSYSLSGGSTLNVGITSPTNFGQIGLAGAAALNGTIAADLRNGFIPAIGNSFPVLTYGSKTGVFTNTALPLGYLWATNYGPTLFTLQVTGTVPSAPSFATNLAAKISGGQLLIQFTGTANASYTVLAATNIALPLTNWTVLGQASQTNLSQFEFLDTALPAYPRRFYIIRTP